MNHSDILVTTTPDLGKIEIEKYIQPVTAHVVIGMNFFKDLFSGITDIIGGNSSAYENTLAEINQKVISELQKKALKLGANCVLGLRIDNDEVSAKSKSMLMVTAIGTAVVANLPDKASIKETQISEISNVESDDELMLKHNIIFKDDSYYYGEYKYPSLNDAVNYAKIQEKNNI